MDPASMEKAMIKNMVNKTGKSIDNWIKIIHKQKLNTNPETVRFLKTNYSLGHFYAHLITRKALK